MPRVVQAIELARPFRVSAHRLCKNQPELGKQVYTAVRRLFDHHDSLGLHREPISVSWSQHLWSCRVNGDVRLLEDESTPLIPRAMYVDRHDEAYRWAQRFRGGGADDVVDVLYRSDQPGNDETHGSLDNVHWCGQQLSGLEQLEYLGAALPEEADMTCIPADELRKLHLSSEDIDRIRHASPDAKLQNYLPDNIFDAVENLYYAYSDAASDSSVSDAAHINPKTTGNAPLPVPLDPEHDTVMITSPDQFLGMLEMGLDRYLMTLTERQAELARVEQRGLLVVQGSGGSGKTTVAAHRLRYLADRIAAQPSLQEDDERRVLYLCYNRTLAEVVRQMLRTLYSGEAPRMVEVRTLHHWSLEYLERRGVLPGFHNTSGKRIYRRVRRDMQGAIASSLVRLHQETGRSARDSARLSTSFIANEIEEVIIGRGLTSVSEYLTADRDGRKSGLRQSDRQYIWYLYKEWRKVLQEDHSIDIKLVPALALSHLLSDDGFVPYDAVIVDEAQDLTPVGLRLAKQLAGQQDRRITIFADAAQSIYRSGFRWKQAELNPRGRQLQRLAQNHRNTAQIWEMATTFLDAGNGPAEPDAYVTAERPEVTGDLPLLLTCPNAQSQVAEVVTRVRARLKAGTPPQNIGILAGLRKQVDSLIQALRNADIPIQTDGNNGHIDITHPSIKALTMHSAKGLDFPHVYLVGLTEGGIPGSPTDSAADELEDDQLELQRRLLYTAMIRAGRTLTMTTIAGQEHSLVRDIKSIPLYATSGMMSALTTPHARSIPISSDE